MLIIIAILISGVSYSNTAGLDRKISEMSDKIGELTSAESELAGAVLDIGRAVGEYGESISAIEKRLKEMEEAEPTPVITEIKIGCVYPLTGPVALEGAHFKEAWEFFANEINMNGGIKSLGGAKLKLIWGDSQGKPEVAMAETERLITMERVSVIVGGWWSSMTYTIQEVCARLHVPNICSSSSSPMLLERGYEWYFHCQLTDDFYAMYEIQFLVELLEKEGLTEKVKKAAILVDDGLFGQTARSSWITFIEELTDWEIVADVTHPTATLDLTVEILKIKEADPDILFLCHLTEDAITAQTTMNEQGYVAPITMTMDAGWIFVDFLAVPECKAGAEYYFSRFAVLPDSPNPRLKKVHDDYIAEYGYWDLGSVPYIAMGSKALLYALEEAASTDPTAIRDALRIIEVPVEDMVMDYGVNFNDETGYNELAKPSIGQMLNGEYRTVWPWESKTVDPVIPDPRSRGLE